MSKRIVYCWQKMALQKPLLLLFSYSWRTDKNLRLTLTLLYCRVPQNFSMRN